MTLERAGWLYSGPRKGDRPFAVVRDTEGRAQKFVCLKCDSETLPDADDFIAHNCSDPRQTIEPSPPPPPDEADDDEADDTPEEE